MAKLFIILGILLVIMGILMMLKIPIPLGKLPGDISFKGKNFQFYFPVVSSILVSIILTLLLNFFSKR